MIVEKRDSDTISWCAGLPESAGRPMNQSEITIIRTEITRYYRKIALTLFMFPALLLICAGMFHLVSVVGYSGPDFITPLAIIYIALIIPIGLIYIRDCVVRSKGLKSDLNIRYLRRFEGELQSIDPADETQSYLLRRSFLRPDLESVQELELLQITSRIHSINGQQLRCWKTASIEETAVRPEIADIAAQWLEPVNESDTNSLFTGNRHLTNDELGELRSKIKRMWRKHLVPAFLLSLWVLSGIIAWKYSTSTITTSNKLHMVWVVVLTLFYDIMFAVDTIQAFKVHKDINLGTVIIVRQEIPVEENKTEMSIGNDYKIFEFLPISRLLWTEGGHPASWRKLKL